MTTDRAYDRLVAANPLPDVERYIAEIHDMDASLRDYTALLDEPEMAATVRAPQRIGRAWVAAAAFVVVVVAAVALSFASFGEGRDAVGDDPIDVVNTFFERWNDGDVDRALALVDPDARINLGLLSVAQLRGLMLYAAEFDGSMDASCSPSDAGLLTCSWTFETASVQAMALVAGPDRRFKVEGGLITSLSTPDYREHENAFAQFAETIDPVGFARECDPDGAVAVSNFGFPFNARCGAFFAGLEAAFVESHER